MELHDQVFNSGRREGSEAEGFSLPSPVAIALTAGTGKLTGTMDLRKAREGVFSIHH